MFTLRLCDPPCHTQNEKAPHHRTTFHGADVDLLMKKKNKHVSENIFNVHLFFYSCVIFIYLAMMFVNCTKANACADPGNYFMGRGCGGYIVCGGGSGSGSGGQSPFFQFFVNYPTPF